MRKLIRAMIAVSVAFVGFKNAKAQVVPASVGPGAYVAVGAGVSGFQDVYGQRDITGGLAYVDVHPQWRVGFEGETRLLRYHTSEDVTESTYLGGLHITLLDFHRAEPYAKLLAGAGTITLPFGYAHGSFLVIAPGAGVDLALNNYVSLRVVDFEYQYWSQFSYGSFSPYGISSGVRVRVTPIAWIPHGFRKRRVRGN